MISCYCGLLLPCHNDCNSVTYSVTYRWHPAVINYLCSKKSSKHQYLEEKLAQRVISKFLRNLAKIEKNQVNELEEAIEKLLKKENELLDEQGQLLMF